MAYRNIVIHMLLIERIGPQTIQMIVQSVGLDHLKNLYCFQVSDFVCLGISQAKAELLVKGLADKASLQKELQLIEQYQVSVVTLWCKQYPQLLKEIHVPPVVLYCQGNLNLFATQQTLACVGARKAHKYVSDAVQAIVIPLVRQGWTIVSGGAAGADTFAHEQTLQANGQTIVVVGSGLCYVFPASNRALFKRAVQQGSLIVSCFSMQTKPESYCFPIRNRIIAGLSQGCLVLQAATKSGALITAHHALQQGREVFALPGSVFDPLSAGCHSLIQQGAKLTASSEDILMELDPNYVYSAVGQADQQPSAVPVQRYGYPVGSIEQQILDCLVHPMSADLLQQQLAIGLDDLQTALFNLSLDGIISQNGVGFWVRI